MNYTLVLLGLVDLDIASGEFAVLVLQDCAVHGGAGVLVVGHRVDVGGRARRVVVKVLYGSRQVVAIHMLVGNVVAGLVPRPSAAKMPTNHLG